MTEKILCASMMCANYNHLENEVHSLENAGIDIFHCDVMDGSFVPNMAVSLQDIISIRQNTKKMVDCHLMIENPCEKVQWFIDAGCDLIYIHPESERFVSKTISLIHKAGRLAGLAINPDTSIDTVREMLGLVDYVLVMTVNPGFAGQKYLEFATEKIRKLIDLKSAYHYKIVIDGACSPERIENLSHMGADGFVLGTSALFGKEKSYQECIQELRG